MATNLKAKAALSASCFCMARDRDRVVAVIAVLFVYRAFKLPRLDANYQADKLQAKITETNSEIRDSPGTRPLPSIPIK